MTITILPDQVDVVTAAVHAQLLDAIAAAGDSAEQRGPLDLADVAAHLTRAAGLLDVLRNLADGA